MIRLSAFADEIAQDVEEQLDALARDGISHLDLRAAWGTPVLQLSDQQVDRLRQLLTARGMRVAAIASPVGKTPIDAPFHQELDRFERAVLLARGFGAPSIRIFSFYPPSGAAASADPAAYRDEVLARLRELTARARAAGVILTHENEKDIYGDTIARCVDLLETIGDAHFVAAFDPANYIQCGQTPYPDAYEAVKPWLAYVHVKDARADGQVVAAGEGIARWPDLLERLRADGYDGIFSLEPHLAAAGRFSGFSGPDLFHHAARSFQEILQAMRWEYA
ncbi:MAG TPA: sugar phosphate isomerase/epimerase [Chloroflexota bacterium]|nr:sugar phosphate isomerase/epimerase [Chloroflexota bacterium]